MKIVMKDIFFKLMLSFLKNYMVFTILPEKMKIEKLVANLHNKKEFVIPIRNLKNSLNH